VTIAADIVAEIESQVDARGLIDHTILQNFTIRPTVSGRLTNAYAMSDEQFFRWWIGQVNACPENPFSLAATQRLRLRMLMLIMLEYAQGLVVTHWREPRED